MFQARLSGPQPGNVACSPGTTWDQWSNACECPDGTTWDGTACVGQSALETLWDAFTTTPVQPQPAPLPLPGVPITVMKPPVSGSGFSFKSPLGIALIAIGAFAGYKFYKKRQAKPAG